MKGIRKDRSGFRVYVYAGRVQRERRFPFGTPLRTMQAWRDQARVTLRATAPENPRGSVSKDVAKYLAKPTIRALAEFPARRSHLAAWVALYGSWPRARLTRTHILEARDRWLEDGLAPKTINHRVRVWAQLCHELDGKHVPTPCDDVPKLPVPEAQPRFVPPITLRRVAKKLTGKDKARFLVLTSTGQRPAQLKRAQPEDVDLRRRVWWVRPAKGGNPIPVFLNDDMLAAWRHFLATDAWGAFDTSDYDKALYAAGWPKDVRPYNAKHSVGFALAEAGADWEDIRDFFGHKDGKTTRIYTGLVASRLKHVSQTLDGRLGWGALVEDSGKHKRRA